MRPPAVSTAILILLLVPAGAARAAWPRDPYGGGLPVCTDPGSQRSPQAVSDGAGGAIVAWADSRSGTQDHYVQRLSAAGVPLWSTDGMPLCTAAGAQDKPVLCRTARAAPS